MKTHHRLLAACAAFLFTVSLLPLRAGAAELVARRIDIQFETLDSGKAPATSVTVLVEDGNGLVAAKYDFARGVAFAGNTNSPEFVVPIIRGPITAGDLRAFKVTIQMHAASGQTDTWRFNHVLRAHMSNGGVITREAQHCGLKSVGGGMAGVSREFQGHS